MCVCVTVCIMYICDRVCVCVCVSERRYYMRVYVYEHIV